MGNGSLDSKKVEEIAEQLRENDNGASQKLLLSVRAADQKVQKPDLNPSDFKDRFSYRSALIDQEKKEAELVFDTLLPRLEDMGLDVIPTYTSQTILVAGTLEKLRGAMSLPEIVDVSIDFEIELIEPIEPESAKE